MAPSTGTSLRLVLRMVWSALVTPDSASFLMSEACGQAESRKSSLTAGVADRQGSRKQPQHGAASRGSLALAQTRSGVLLPRAMGAADAPGCQSW